jgi:nicotinamidase-related amidase
VTSEYYRAQFSEGNTQHPLANLCVPGENSDCDLAGNIAKLHFQSHNIKHAPSALSSDEFNSEIDNDLKEGVRTFVVAGFLLEHCVRWTAQELMVKVADYGATVCVCSNFSASRLEKYRNGEVESTIAALNSVGIGYDVWQSIKP